MVRRGKVPGYYERVQVDGSRFRLPKAFAEMIAWLKPTESPAAWLLLIEPGRFRLLSDQQVNASERLRAAAEKLRKRPEPDPELEPWEAESSESAATLFRLIPAAIAPLDSGWRLTLPEFGLSDNAGQAPRTVCVLFSEGYPEIWSLQRLAQALHTPLNTALP